MNQAIEDYLAELITSVPFVPAPEIFTGTSSDIRPPESYAVPVLADSIETVVGPLIGVRCFIATKCQKCCDEAPDPKKSGEVDTAVPDHKKWGAKCLTLLGEIGGLGNGYEFHDWTTPARAPVPVPPPADTKPPAPPEKKDPASSPKPARNLNPQD